MKCWHIFNNQYNLYFCSFYQQIFIALFVYAVSAEENKPAEEAARVKKHAYVAAAPARKSYNDII